MNQEQLDFEYFRDNQLHAVDFTLGIITTKGGRWGNHLYYDIGSENPDGYERLWCNGKLRMKHRLMYFLYHNELPALGEEIDHFDRVRNNNKISNLRCLLKADNNTACSNRKIGRFTDQKIKQACQLLQDTDLSDQQIADQLKVSRATIRDIKTRRSRIPIAKNYSWQHRGY